MRSLVWLSMKLWFLIKGGRSSEKRRLVSENLPRRFSETLNLVINAILQYFLFLGRIACKFLDARQRFQAANEVTSCLNSVHASPSSAPLMMRSILAQVFSASIRRTAGMRLTAIGARVCLSPHRRRLLRTDCTLWPLFERGGQADEGADVFGNRPQQQDRFFAFFFESVQKAGDAQGIAFHPCAGELEYVETGDVGDGGFGIGDVDGMVLRVQQGEFVDFFADLQAQGFARVRVDGEVYQLDEVPKLEKTSNTISRRHRPRESEGGHQAAAGGKF